MRARVCAYEQQKKRDSVPSKKKGQNLFHSESVNGAVCFFYRTNTKIIYASTPHKRNKSFFIVIIKLLVYRQRNHCLVIVQRNVSTKQSVVLSTNKKKR
jgi:hypothetical protein